MAGWKVVPYSIENLRRLFTSRFPETERSVGDSVHDRYFEDYFAALQAKTILLESDYTDHDFLEDFAAYYVRCFADYDRRCTRLHFFDREVSEREVSTLLEGGSQGLRKLPSSYLGFIIVRPIPGRPVGRTCLRTYPDDGGQRRYTNLRDCDANLFGIPLTVKSLAFQQQDRTVAECATSALWSALQATGMIFNHRIPSPAAITEAATRRVPLDRRTLPTSSGLSPEQMADAVRACGLEPLLVGATVPWSLRAAVHAYAGIGIPVILIGDVMGDVETDNGHEWQSLGLHAVTVTGYRVPKSAAGTNSGLLSDGIDQFYAHDDAVGPFARMAFLPEAYSELSTSLADNKSAIGTRRFRPSIVLVPVYHKIRVSFDRVLGEILSLDEVLEKLRSATPSAADLLPPTRWDLQLTTTNHYKSRLRVAADVSEKRRALEMRMPRYIWLVRAEHADGTGFDLVFDATGIDSDNLCFAIVDRGSPLLDHVRAIGLKPDEFNGAEGAARRLLGVADGPSAQS